jgi:hypothetical protein
LLERRERRQVTSVTGSRGALKQPTAAVDECRMFRVILVVGGLAAAALLSPLTASAANSSCGAVADGAAWNVQAVRTSCSTARAVARAIVLGSPAVKCAERDGVGGFDPCRYRGYTCRSTRHVDSARYRCVNGQRRVSFAVRVGSDNGSE